MESDKQIVQIRWRGKQSAALLDRTPNLCIEGAIRSSKTTLALWKIHDYLVTYPGIHWLMSRWTDDATDGLLKPMWKAVCEVAGTRLEWHPNEHFYSLPNGSIVYVHGLRASEDTSRYAKLRGKELAGAWVDQTEELAADFLPELQGRLSQRGFPRQLICTPNSVPEDHWIATTFPESNDRPGYKLYQFSVYDNAHNLDPDYIRSLEQAYPVGHPKRRTLVEGLRGLNVTGQPVYADCFDRDRHLVPVTLNPDLPLLEALDYGKHHPAVVWGQLTALGGFDLLGGLMGRDLPLVDFLPLVLHYRAQWFPGPLDVWTCCDPAGTHDNSHGTIKGVDVMRAHGLYPRWVEGSNAPTIRRACIETLMGLMRRRTATGEAFRCHPSRWLVLSATEATSRPFVPQALEGGYVWDARMRSTAGGKSIAVPLKDGWYEHGQNCTEYLLANFGSANPSQRDVQRATVRLASQRLREAQRDNDPFRWSSLRASRPVGRGGY